MTKITQGAITVLFTLVYTNSIASAQKCGDLEFIPTDPNDFDEPAWETILELAFPTWATPANGCPRLDAVGGSLLPNYTEFSVAEAGKFNPCYYTKAFAGLDPSLGGYPTPIDTHYPYEFAAPFLKQPGDGSTHHCKHGDVDIGACPKLGKTCGPDCTEITSDYGIGHIPPFVPLAAIKNAYSKCDQDVCNWFHFETNGCSIKKSKLDELVYEYFGDGNTIKYQPPILIDGMPSTTYFKLEYGGESPACDDGNCRGPHYCSKDVADAGNIWGDFCPYVHTGENSGLYRHPHLALAALELWIANQCMPDKCAAQWLDSPNGQGYGTDFMKATSITWCEMENNHDPISQPVVPYVWPTSAESIFPGHYLLYGDMGSKPSPGLYVNEFVDVSNSCSEEPPCGANDWTFKVEDKSGKGCGWVGAYPYDRCLVSTGAKEHCAETCCGITADEPEIDCGLTNWDFRVGGESGRGCGWIGLDPDTRCLNEGAKENCGTTCCYHENE